MISAPSGLVSVIVPVYNGEKHLRGCVESILNQTHGDIELILVDDGSTDGSDELCDAFVRQDGRVRAIHTQNHGVSCARNAGLRAAAGEFLCFVDSDDFIEKDAVSALMKGIGVSGADMVVGAYNKVRRGRILSQVRDFSQGQLLTRKGVVDYALSYLHNPRQHQLLNSSWAKLFRTRIIRDRKLAFREDLRIAEDVAFNFDYLKNVEKVYFLSEVIYNHQKFDTCDSLSTRFIENEPKGLFGYYSQALGNVSDFFRADTPQATIDKAVGQGYGYHAALFTVRICGQISWKNFRALYRLMNEQISDPDFRSYIKSYDPAAGNYRLIPFFMRLRLTGLLIGAAWFEARKQYTAS